MSSSLWAQVGIGTDLPDATLDVNGTVRVTSIRSTTTNDITETLIGISSAQKLNRTERGSNISFVDGEGLIFSPVMRTMGDRVIVSADYNSGVRIDNLNLYLSSGEIHEITSFLHISGYNSTTRITGITGGIHGRKVTLYFSESSTVNILNRDSNSLPKNRIVTLTNTQLNVNGIGLIELVYDENYGTDGLGRWIVVKFKG